MAKKPETTILDGMRVKDDNILVNLTKVQEEAPSEDDILVSFSDPNLDKVDDKDPAKEEEEKTKKEKNIKTLSWGDSPPMGKSVEECLNDPDLNRIVNVRTYVLDLSIEEHLNTYDTFLTNQTKPNTNKIITAEERQWSDISDTWKVFLQITTFEYKQL